MNGSAPSYGPAGSAASPAITNTSGRCCSRSQVAICLACTALSTSRAEMCGVGRCPSVIRRSAYSCVTAMPLAGEHVTDTSACGGSASIASSIDFIGTISKCRLRANSAIAGDDSVSPFDFPNGQSFVTTRTSQQSNRTLWQEGEPLGEPDHRGIGWNSAE